MENLKDLLVKSESDLTNEESSFLALHNQILYTGATVTSYMIEFAKNLKEMRDSKLYKQAGFETFEEYSEKALNLKQRQAYKYVEVYENLSEEFLHSNAKMGITKLHLLSRLGVEDREEIAEKIVTKDLTVEELKQEIAEKENRIKQLEMGVEDEKQKAIDNANKKADKAKKDLEKAIKEKDDLYKKYEELKNAPVKVDVVDNPETLKKLEEIALELENKQEEIVKLNKKLGLVSNSKLMIFKVKFEELQVYLSGIISLIDEMENEDKEKCNKALKAVLGAYL